ncbi:MAG: methyltransferase domain-containing protein, partial [Myxococcales bacterium]|nr:methyltransferase domain-containing protein [Myxococcales bacterium]
RHDYAEVCRALELRGDERVIDAGGGLGVLAQHIVDAHPLTQVTVLERPEVVAMAPSGSAVQWLDGSLFEPWEARADAVVLARVLHDWDDAEAIQILKRARAALSSGGRVYVVEMMASETSVAGALCDLHLLVVTGGRERSASHLRRLLETAGFGPIALRRLPALPSVLVGAVP